MIITDHRTTKTLTKQLRQFILGLLADGEKSQRDIYQAVWDHGNMNRSQGRDLANLRVNERITALIQDGLVTRERKPHAVIKLVKKEAA